MTDQDYISELKGVTSDLGAADRVAAQLREERRKLMIKARLEGGLTYSAIASAAGVTKAYVHQQVVAEQGKVTE